MGVRHPFFEELRKWLFLLGYWKYWALFIFPQSLKKLLGQIDPEFCPGLPSTPGGTGIIIPQTKTDLLKLRYNSHTILTWQPTGYHLYSKSFGHWRVERLTLNPYPLVIPLAANHKVGQVRTSQSAPLSLLVYSSLVLMELESKSY